MAAEGSSDPNGYKILLMNCNGPTGSTVPQRQRVFNEILEDFKPSIIFTQECAPGIDPISDRYEQIRGDGSASNTGFIYNIDEFKELKLNLLPLMKLLLLFAASEDYKRRLGGYCPPLIAEKFKERVAIQLFESKREPNFQVLAVSWHGPHRFGDEDKRMLLVYMFFYVKNLHSLLETPEGKHRTVLIGGDFNLKIQRWWQLLPDVSFQNNIFNAKGAIRESKGQIDFFVSSTNLEVRNVEPYVPPCTVGLPVSHKKLFDHDPMKAIIRFKVPDQTVNLAQEFGRMRISQKTPLHQPPAWCIHVNNVIIKYISFIPNQLPPVTLVTMVNKYPQSNRFPK